jgi:glycosyltransferase involved in cell wall biosynthesis
VPSTFDDDMISFVVPAYNEEQLLSATLSSIHSAARAVGHPYEVIVVDDASTDATAAIALAHGARVVPVRFRQIARTRNAGAHAAAGSTLVFVDADTVVTSSTLRATVEAVGNGAVGGGATVQFGGTLPLWARLMLPILRGVMRAGRLAAGCYVFCSRAAFEAIGGFDESLYAAEEIAFSRALGRHGRVVILRDTVTTSGRKMRSHSGWEVLGLVAGLLRRGTAVVRSRERLAMWYGDRRNDTDGEGRRMKEEG